MNSATNPNRAAAALAKLIQHYASFSQRSVTLRSMIEFGANPDQLTLLQAASFLREELPVRLAHRVVQFNALPEPLAHLKPILRVKGWYEQSFRDLVEFPKIEIPRQGVSKPKVSYGRLAIPEKNAQTTKELPANAEEINQKFVDVIDKIKKRHDATVTTIAQGITEWKAKAGGNVVSEDVTRFLDSFLMSRIGIRFLIGQHIALSKNPGEDHVGIICPKTNVAEVVQDAIGNARFICQDYYGLMEAPKVALFCNPKLTFPYVPSHLEHMVFELLKNSCRAVVEHCGKEASHFPDIKLIVAEGNEDLTIKISDEGGGIPRSAMPKVWTYMYTTAESPDLDPDFNKGDFKAPMAGYGYGLPLSRLYAKYFGGDLILISMEGYGTDAYLHLSRVGDNSEPLP